MLLFGGAAGPSTFTTLRDDTWLLTHGARSELRGGGPSSRGSPAVGHDPRRNAVVLYGGFDASGGLLRDTREWDGSWRCRAGC